VTLSFLLAKIVVSAGLVVAVTAVAERFGPRVGGLAASVPQLAVAARPSLLATSPISSTF